MGWSLETQGWKEPRALLGQSTDVTSETRSLDTSGKNRKHSKSHVQFGAQSRQCSSSCHCCPWPCQTGSLRGGSRGMKTQIPRHIKSIDGACQKYASTEILSWTIWKWLSSGVTVLNNPTISHDVKDWREVNSKTLKNHRRKLLTRDVFPSKWISL